RAAIGTWIGFLDADDRWAPTFAARVRAACDADDARAGHAGVRLIDEEGRPLGERLEGRGGRALIDLVTHRRPVFVSGGSGLLVERALLDEIGGFEETLSTSADWDLYRRVAERTWLAWVAEPLVEYRLHGGQMHTNLERWERDMQRALKRALAGRGTDWTPALRREAWGRLYRQFAGARFREGSYGRCLAWAARALTAHPAEFAYFLGVLGRRRGPGAGGRV
ncbi:MAG: hypothetical protein D6701_09630, partial [Gemmatimonadetes bacterium]